MKKKSLKNITNNDYCFNEVARIQFSEMEFFTAEMLLPRHWFYFSVSLVIVLGMSVLSIRVSFHHVSKWQAIYFLATLSPFRHGLCDGSSSI